MMDTLEPTETLVDVLLAEQRKLTAVEKFSQLHERHRAPMLESHYRDLIPLSAARPGEQYAFEVDLDKCSGCKACVSACHSLNGLDEGEAWRSVGSLFGERLVREGRGNRVVPLQQTVTTACHHCIEPACLNGCPVLAYDKDPITGIVRHLSDQCIGCSYCVMKCPYEVPKFSARRGIVRKCDMCHDRLSVGEAPACVQACPSEAIRITLTEIAAVKATLVKTKTWLPDSPAPNYTFPSTRFISSKPNSDLLATDHFTLRKAPAHWPLILMLVLTQAGIGGTLLASPSHGRAQSVLALAVFISGLLASAFHLGQPMKAWRIWLGWRTSWLSREAMVLGAFAGASGLAVGAPGNQWLTLAVGAAALIAQAMVYSDTHRDFWRLPFTLPRFIGSALSLGLGLRLALSPSAAAATALVAVMLCKLAVEIACVHDRNLNEEQWSQRRRTAALQYGLLRPVLATRFILGLIGGALIPFGMAVGAMPLRLGSLAFCLCIAGELAERYLFFASVAPDKMPGPL